MLKNLLSQWYCCIRVRLTMGLYSKMRTVLNGKKKFFFQMTFLNFELASTLSKISPVQFDVLIVKRNDVFQNRSCHPFFKFVQS